MPDTLRSEGRLRIWVGPPDAPGEPYRELGDAPLVIERVAGAGPAPQRRAPVVGVIALVNVALLAFASYVRSWPAVGTVGVALIALLWLVLYLGRDRASEETVRLALDRRLRGPEIDVAVEEVRGVGVGQGAAGSRTVWVATPRGRILVLESLSDLEAEAAADALREAVERRRGRAAPARSPSPA